MLQDNAYDVVRSSCDPAKGHVVDHPVAFLVRDRYTHTLHELEMVRAAWTLGGVGWIFLASRTVKSTAAASRVVQSSTAREHGIVAKLLCHAYVLDAGFPNPKNGCIARRRAATFGKGNIAAHYFARSHPQMLG